VLAAGGQARGGYGRMNRPVQMVGSAAKMGDIESIEAMAAGGVACVDSVRADGNSIDRCFTPVLVVNHRLGTPHY